MKEITINDNIESIISEELVIIIAKTRNCSVCTPVSQRLEMMLEDFPNVPLYQAYVDELEELRGQFLLFTVPTVLIFSNGKEILRESRFVNFENIKRLLTIFTS